MLSDYILSCGLLKTGVLLRMHYKNFTGMVDQTQVWAIVAFNGVKNNS